MVPAAAQLDRIEALIRQIAPTAATLQQRQLMPQPGPPSAASSPAAAHILASAIASSSLTARQRALLDSAQRVQTAICTSLALGFCELRLTAAASPLLGGQSLVSTLPLSHLYTLVPPPRRRSAAAARPARTFPSRSTASLWPSSQLPGTLTSLRRRAAPLTRPHS